jgi:NADH-quinone oxidoreductase subunit M
MTELHLPWLEVSVLAPLLGAAWVARCHDREIARKWCLMACGGTLLVTTGAWQDFRLLGAVEAQDHWRLLSRWSGYDVLVIDQLSAPLLPLAALVYFLTTIATARTKYRRFSFSATLISEAILLGTLSCKDPRWVIGLLAVGTIPPYFELVARKQPTRVYLLHMALFVGLMIAGWSCVEYEGQRRVHTLWAIVPLFAAVLIRCGMSPFHCWMTELFEHATFGTALLFVVPMVGAYAAVRLVLPVAPDWILRSMGLISLVTAVYASGMALVERDGRRFFCYLFLSHSALVGLEMVTPIGLTGALCVWLSVSLALAGFGLTMRAVEARRGRLSLVEFGGFYDHAPNLAVCFVLTGLASVGFPGTFGFVGTDMLVDGAVEAYPYVGVAVVLAAALNGIAIVQAYFRIFAGTSYASSVSLKIRVRERYAVLALAALILIGGLYPQPYVEGRHVAAKEILLERNSLSAADPTAAAGHPTGDVAERSASRQK